MKRTLKRYLTHIKYIAAFAIVILILSFWMEKDWNQVEKAKEQMEVITYEKQSQENNGAE